MGKQKHLTCLTCKNQDKPNHVHLRSNNAKRYHHDHELVNCQCIKAECKERLFKVPLSKAEIDAKYRQKHGAKLAQNTKAQYIPMLERAKLAAKEIADGMKLFDDT